MNDPFNPSSEYEAPIFTKVRRTNSNIRRWRRRHGLTSTWLMRDVKEVYKRTRKRGKPKSFW